MERATTSGADMEKVIFEIPMKLPSLNDYINACRTNAYKGAKMKKDLQREMSWYLRNVPKFRGKVHVHFQWQEENKRRDLDNVAFAKKFILDALVDAGVLENDDRKHVGGFSDSFTYGDRAKVTVTISGGVDK